MQYGNATFGIEFSKLKYRLNRTMQYGNIIPSTSSFSWFIWFKSYYVVWKLWKAPIAMRGLFLFKSYYVVWKLFFMLLCLYYFYRLNRTMQYGNYSCSKTETQRFASLNRTMQYGNSSLAEFFLCVKKFKSYYVVWKQIRWMQ